MNEKQYLGGYKNKRNGKEYHHAATQTDQYSRKRGKNSSKYCNRGAQTSILTSKCSQTRKECGAQTQRNRLSISEGGRLLTPKSYMTGDQLLGQRYISTINIQKTWRGFKGRDRVRKIKLFNENEERETFENKLHLENYSIDLNLCELERRLHPKSKKDFSTLYSELESWREEETKKIKGLNTENGMSHLKYQLLEKETKILRRIDTMKADAMETNKIEQISKKLAMMTKPKKWELSNGDVAAVHTPFTTRATKLKDLYERLILKNLTVDDRLNVLLQIKQTIENYDCILTRDMINLIDREADLLNRGRSVKTLSGLRTRLKNLFMQYIEAPEFNPESNRFLKVSRDVNCKFEIQ